MAVWLLGRDVESFLPRSALRRTCGIIKLASMHVILPSCFSALDESTEQTWIFQHVSTHRILIIPPNGLRATPWPTPLCRRLGVGTAWRDRAPACGSAAGSGTLGFPSQRRPRRHCPWSIEGLHRRAKAAMGLMVAQISIGRIFGLWEEPITNPESRAGVRVQSKQINHGRTDRVIKLGACGAVVTPCATGLLSGRRRTKSRIPRAE